MIEFKSDREKEIVYYYAKLMGGDVIESLSRKEDISENDVRLIAKFYWDLVDVSAKEKSQNTEKFENMEMWLERIYTSLHIHFNNIGYDKIWDNEIPES